MQRRTFLQTSSLGLAGLSLSNGSLKASPIKINADHTFKLSLNTGTIGVAGPVEGLMAAAAEMGFEAIAMSSGELINKSGEQLQDLLIKAQSLGLSWGCAGLPVQFRTSLDQFNRDLEALPKHARAMQTLGIDRVGTWIMPCHEDLSYGANFALHAGRLRQTAAILADHNIRLGLEYVAPRTLRNAQRFAFIDNGKQLKELILSVGQPNVGVILDSFHWYCAEETANDLRIWSKTDIVAVDLNDADINLEPREQFDGNRELPGATGKIDIASFIAFLDNVGFDGPVRAEPFNSTLNAMKDGLAMQATMDAMQAVLA